MEETKPSYNDTAVLEERLGVSLATAVKERVIQEPWLAHHLLVVSEDAALLEKLLDKLTFETNKDKKSRFSEIPQTSLSPAKALNAIKAVAGAVATKSKRASAELRQIRLSACHSCPNLKSALGRELSTGIEKINLCSLCGCVVELKVRILEEKCPGTSSLDSSKNRWGEPLK